MALTANVNEIYTAKFIKTGVSSKGAWELIVIEAHGKDRARIPLWVQNVPSGVVEGGRFSIASIVGARIRHIKPSNRYDKWQDEFSLDAYITPIIG